MADRKYIIKEVLKLIKLKEYVIYHFFNKMEFFKNDFMVEYRLKSRHVLNLYITQKLLVLIKPIL